MSEHQHTIVRERIVCAMNASSSSRTVLEAAISYCRERDAELVVVWVVSPNLGSPAEAGMHGTWGLIGAHATMVERLRDDVDVDVFFKPMGAASWRRSVSGSEPNGSSPPRTCRLDAVRRAARSKIRVACTSALRCTRATCVLPSRLLLARRPRTSARARRA